MNTDDTLKNVVETYKLLKNFTFNLDYISELLNIQVSELNALAGVYKIPEHVKIQSWTRKLFNGRATPITYISSNPSQQIRGDRIDKALEKLGITLSSEQFFGQNAYMEIVPVLELEDDRPPLIRILYCWWPMIKEFEKKFENELRNFQNKNRIQYCYSPIPQSEFYKILHCFGLKFTLEDFLKEKFFLEEKYTKVPYNDNAKIRRAKILLGLVSNGFKKLKDKLTKEIPQDLMRNGTTSFIKEYLSKFKDLSEKCLKGVCPIDNCIEQGTIIKDWLFSVSSFRPPLTYLCKPATGLYLLCKRWNPFLITEQEDIWRGRIKKYFKEIEECLNSLDKEKEKIVDALSEDLKNIASDIILSKDKSRRLKIAIINEWSQLIIDTLVKASAKPLKPLDIYFVTNDYKASSSKNRDQKIGQLKTDLLLVKDISIDNLITKLNDEAQCPRIVYLSCIILAHSGESLKPSFIFTEKGTERILTQIQNINSNRPENEHILVRCLAPNFKAFNICTYINLSDIKDYYIGDSFDCVSTEGIKLLPLQLSVAL